MNIMIDIETLATGADAHIVSIGALLFNPDTGEHGQQLHLRLNKNGQNRRKVCPDTVAWWMKQSTEAQQELLGEPRISLQDALKKLAQFVPRGCEVWSKGGFDDQILMHAYQYTYMDGVWPPWKYWQWNDGRTIAKQFKGTPLEQPKHTGVAHNALDDCIFQASWLVPMLQQIKQGNSND